VVVGLGVSEGVNDATGEAVFDGVNVAGGAHPLNNTARRTNSRAEEADFLTLSPQAVRERYEQDKCGSNYAVHGFFL